MEVRRCLRRWRKGKGGERTYKKEKKNYKELCERKKKEENEKWTEMAEKINTESKVWEVVNRERKKWRGINRNIEKEEWTRYFMNVLGGVSRKVMNGEGQRRADNEEEISKAEVKKVIL